MSIHQHKSLNDFPEYKPNFIVKWWNKLKSKFQVDNKDGTTFGEYLSIPILDREFLGFYRTPKYYVMESSCKDDLLGSKQYERYWKETYPVQFFFRNDVYYFFKGFKWKWERVRDRCKRVFKSENHRHNNVIPREYQDDCSLIPHVLLQMFKNFQKEIDSGIVDWDAMDHTSEFLSWYKKTKYKVDVVFPYIDKRLTKAYDQVEKVNEVPEEFKHLYKNSFFYVYRYVHFWEKMEKDLTTNICKEIIDRRECFWT